MSPVQNISMGRGGTEHDAADATMAAHVGHRFTGKVAIVTGAASGIGRATAQRLAAEGAVVAGLDINEEGLEETVGLITAARFEGETGKPAGRAVAYRCDVTSEESVDVAVTAVAADLGTPSVLCNVAGIGGFFHTMDMPVQRWREIVDVNLTGPFLMCRATLPYLIEQGGAIVNISSNTGLTGQAYTAAYCSSKAGVLMLSKALAAEYQSRGVRVNTVAPGPTDTAIIASFDLPEGADGKQLYKMMTPMGYATSAEMAASIAFLASDDSPFTTGAVLSVDGGLSV
ncbi:MAG TPA: SDR family NAD(P)-dependent oxidoreductase [Acidimicrobiales bacterium]|nr:SDR family NAD(P)-dependent oxidoreductase [Acidimicrobiales bacterium]